VCVPTRRLAAHDPECLLVMHVRDKYFVQQEQRQSTCERSLVARGPGPSSRMHSGRRTSASHSCSRSREGPWTTTAAQQLPTGSCTRCCRPLRSRQEECFRTARTSFHLDWRTDRGMGKGKRGEVSVTHVLPHEVNILDVLLRNELVAARCACVRVFEGLRCWSYLQ
jgi:hypothetical protein